MTRFENLDASVVASGLIVTGSTDANSIITGRGNDVIDGGGGRPGFRGRDQRGRRQQGEHQPANHVATIARLS